MCVKQKSNFNFQNYDNMVFFFRLSCEFPMILTNFFRIRELKMMRIRPDPDLDH